jgi:hypothetical protein
VQRRKTLRSTGIIGRYWPWDREWWKPTPNNRIRELAKAGALIAAEIDRLQRLEERKAGNGVIRYDKITENKEEK